MPWVGGQYIMGMGQYTMDRGSIYHGYEGQNTMGRGDQNTMGRWVDIP